MWLERARSQPEAVTNTQEASTKIYKLEDDGVLQCRGKKPYPISGPRGRHKFQTSKTLMLEGLNHQGTHYA